MCVCVVCEVILHTDTVCNTRDNTDYVTKREREDICVYYYLYLIKEVYHTTLHVTTCTMNTHAHTHLVLLFEDYNTEKSLNVSL